MKKGVLEISQNSQEKTRTRVKKRDSARVLSCEFREIFKNIFFAEHLWTTASVIIWIFTDICIVIVTTTFVAQRRI